MTIRVRDADGVIQEIPTLADLVEALGVTRFYRTAGSALVRPANTTPYDVGDGIEDNATAGSVTAHSVLLADINDAPFTVEAVTLATNDTGPGAVEAFMTMILYDIDPTLSSGVGAGDNAAYTQKRAGEIGSLSGTFSARSDGSVARLVPASGDNRIIVEPTSGGKTIWWRLLTRSAFTPSANSTSFTPVFEGFYGRV